MGKFLTVPQSYYCDILLIDGSPQYRVVYSGNVIFTVDTGLNLDNAERLCAKLNEILEAECQEAVASGKIAEKIASDLFPQLLNTAGESYVVAERNGDFIDEAYFRDGARLRSFTTTGLVSQAQKFESYEAARAFAGWLFANRNRFFDVFPVSVFERGATNDTG